VKIAEDGEILVKSDYLFKSYFREDELTRQTFDKDGWYKTGDVGNIVEGGYIALTGRKKEIINKGGYKVSPRQIDLVLLKHGAVRDAATIGIANPIYGEEIYSFVVANKGEDRMRIEEELLEYCSTQLNSVICPRKVFVINEMPLNATGKTDKFQLEKIYTANCQRTTSTGE
jgi:acyl-CoA synthetase (AMP-forming)/AMP-acid ligase II